MKRIILAFWILIALCSSSFSMEPYTYFNDLRKCNNYDKPKGSLVSVDEGIKITVKPANYLWGQYFKMPESTRYLSTWSISIYVLDSNGAYFGLGIGHERAGVNFFMNSSGKYYLGSWSENSPSRRQEGRTEQVSFPVKIGLTYNTVKTELTATVNDEPILIITPEKYRAMPQLGTVKIVEIGTVSESGQVNKWAVYRNLIINATE